MPPKRNLGKAVQTLQIGLGESSPTHSEGENEPILPPPLSPILREHSFVNPTFNKGSESGDDVAQSGDSLVKANLAHSVAQSVADMWRSNEESNRIWREQNVENWRAFQAETERMQEAFRRVRIEPQPQPPPQIQQVAGGPVQPDPVEAAPREAYGPVLRPLVRPAYRKPYPDFIDQENPFPRGFKVPEFTLFSGDALTWYLSLPQNSVYTWRQMEDLFHIQFYRSEPEVSMADLSRLVQRPGETSEAFLARFRKARLKCRVALPKQEFVKLAQNGLDIELRKKFEGMEFRDFFELSYKEKIDKGILRFPNKAKETMGVDADPFPTMSIGVNAADLRSIARDRSQTYYRRRLVADDLRWVIEEARTRRNQVRSGSYRRRQPGGHNSTQQKNNANLAKKPRMVKPPPRSPTKRWERVVHPKFPKGQNPRTLRRRLQRKRAAERHQQQITNSGGMADQAQPLPARRKSVWVRKEKGSSSGQNAPKKGEPPRIPTSPRVLAVESNEETGLKAKFDVPDKAKNSSDVICFGEFSVNLSCLVITLPLVFQARDQLESAVCHQTDLTEEEEVIEIPAKEEGGMDSADKIIFEKPEERMAKHIRPLYI
ncbi:hypothetical protein SLEP1_g10138 [Rubroshorea leprosula]|uniref:Retrotransposon gag domain-containing protein n=1 Tax=Rubroshorea leprosula TaxID=152421 RepID=A0AAV5ID27_9ROSI|nr:hypothetical protein SLEP1_g10138 [Rubroshorea leprosula]